MEENEMKITLASAAVAAAVLVTAVPANAQFYAGPFVGSGYYYGPAYPYWGGPRVLIAPPLYGVVPAYGYGLGWGPPYWRWSPRFRREWATGP